MWFLVRLWCRNSRVCAVTDVSRPYRAKSVTLLEGLDLALRVFRRGARPAGAPCNLVIALNGEERSHLREPCGAGAPAEAIVDIRTEADAADDLIRAIETRPWLCPEMPVITYPTAHQPEEGVILSYLIRCAGVEQVIETIENVLDIAAGPTQAELAETPLDAA